MTLLKKVKTMSKEEIGKHLFLAIVQTKNNHALLEHCIHRKFLDLSVLCNYEFSVGKELLSIGLSKMLLDQIQLSEEEAFELAYKNSCTKGMLQEAEVFRTMAMLRKKVDSDFPIPRVHLAYSLQKEYGANIMLNQGFLKMASDRLGGNYYVMPISRWEVMLISGAIDQTTEERIRLNKIMKDVTVMGYDPEVIVSDHAYFYISSIPGQQSGIMAVAF